MNLKTISSINKDMIALIDSGAGGVNVLSKCAKLFPYDYILLVDNKNAPYGNKTKKQLYKITKNNIDYLIKNYKISAIIFACNTLSFTIYEKIKKEYNIPILKMQFNEKEINKLPRDILFFGTKNTIKNNKKIIEKNNWKPLYITDLPIFIDNNIANLEKIKPLIIKNAIKYNNIKTIVLSCTHFSIIKKQLKDIFKDAIFYEYEQNVAQNLQNLLKPKNYRTMKIILTQKDHKKYIELKSLLAKLTNSH